MILIYTVHKYTHLITHTDMYIYIFIKYIFQRWLESLLAAWHMASPGLCILTTNARDAIDSAFFRRFRFMVEPGAQTMIKIDTL